MKQLLIDFEEKDYPNFNSFLGSQNQELLSILQSDEFKLTFIWGPEGIGKSHLLKSWLKHQFEQDKKVALISMLQPEYLGVAFNYQYQSIAIDNIHCFDEESQIQLFNLFNTILDLHGRLLISANAPPQQLIELRSDLRTRLGLCCVYEIYPLTEEEKLKTMKEFITIKQTNISDQVFNYLIAHAPRNLNFLLSTLQAIDDYAIKIQRKVTIPLLKQFLLERNNG